MITFRDSRPAHHRAVSDLWPETGLPLRNHPAAQLRVGARTKKILLGLILLGLLTAAGGVGTPCARAADPLYLLTQGDQDTLLLGRIAAIEGAVLTLDPVTTLAGMTSRGPVQIEQRATRASLQVGDQVVVSADMPGGALLEKWGVFQVNGEEAADLTILAGPYSPGELLAIQRYLRSGGLDNDFAVEGQTIYLRHPDGSREMIFPVTGVALPQRWTETPVAGAGRGLSQSGWHLEYLALAAVVLVLLYVLIRHRPKPPSRRRSPS